MKCLVHARSYTRIIPVIHLCLRVQPLALLMDSVAAKDLACLLAGYCKLLVDNNINVFRWGPRPKIRRIPLDEGNYNDWSFEI